MGRTVHVLVTDGRITKEHLDMVAAVAPCIQVRHMPYMVPWDEHSARQRALSIEGSPPDTHVTPELREALARAEVIFGFHVPLRTRALAPNLRWIQQPGAGVDHLLATDVMDGSVLVTNNRGGTAPLVAEFVMAALLFMTKRLPQYLELQRQKKWQLGAFTVEPLAGKTMGLVGYGPISQEIAKRAQAFQMRVLATRRRPAPPEVPVERFFVASEVNAMLAQSHVVVLSVPLTRETLRSFGRPQFQAMRRGSYLINIARGSVVDDEALLEALRQGTLAGAFLDVQAHEPLPPEHPLWTEPNVYITPHSAVFTGDVRTDRIKLFCDNLRHYLKGEPLLNRIDPVQGY